MNEVSMNAVYHNRMARLQIRSHDISPGEVALAPGCNRIGREGENEILLPHDSVSRKHCEVWLMEDAVLVRDLQSRNGTFVNGERITEAEWLEGQTLRVGDIELVLADAPVRISVPDLPLPTQPKQQQFFEDGTPACLNHDAVAAIFHCTGKCGKMFCGECVRELRVAGGAPRRFCPECGGQCERLAPTARAAKRSSWLSKIKDAFTKSPPRRMV
jgi:hypothetical protein